RVEEAERRVGVAACLELDLRGLIDAARVVREDAGAALALAARRGARVVAGAERPALSGRRVVRGVEREQAALAAAAAVPLPRAVATPAGLAGAAHGRARRGDRRRRERGDEQEAPQGTKLHRSSPCEGKSTRRLPRAGPRRTP